MSRLDSAAFSRLQLLLGTASMQRIAATRVIVFGVGGVGSWCAESLVRSGIGHLTLVDFDTVSHSNLNRQLMATVETIGQSKVEALRDRLLSINPDADIAVRQDRFTEENAATFLLDTFDYVVDAIDSLHDKAILIREACASEATLYSSMGAALKLNPTGIQVTEFWKVKGCPLGAALRHYFRKEQIRPAKKFQCVFSEELLANHPVEDMAHTPGGASREQEGTCPGNTGTPGKANGSIVHITAIFGFTLAGLIIQDIARQDSTGHS